MTLGVVGDVELFYEAIGSGPSLVLVHGSWGDHGNWAAVVPLLAEGFQVVTYDRRGHSRSSGQGSVADDADDLAGLIELLDLAPAIVAGNSFGSLIALRMASARPDLLRGLVVHEPPGLGLLTEEPAYAALLEGFGKRHAAVVVLLESERHAEAAELFVDTIALGPGGWAGLPARQQDTFVHNAMTYLEECRDPDASELNLDQLRAYTGPALLTQGDQSPPMFAPVLDLIQAVLPQSERQTYVGAGHVPHMTHPRAYADALFAFDRAVDNPRAVS